MAFLAPLATAFGATAATASTIGTVASVAGTVMSVGGSLSSIGGATKEAGRQVSQVGYKTSVTVRDRVRQSTRLVGRQRAGFGKAGVVVDSGSAARVQEETYGDLIADLETIKYEAENEIRGVKTSRDRHIMSAKGDIAESLLGAAGRFKLGSPSPEVSNTPTSNPYSDSFSVSPRQTSSLSRSNIA